MDKIKSAAVGGIVTFIWCILDFVISLIANNFGDPRRVAMVVILLIVSVLGVVFILLRKPIVGIVMYGIGVVAAVLHGIFMNMGLLFSVLNVGVLALVLGIVLLVLGMRENEKKDN